MLLAMLALPLTALRVLAIQPEGRRTMTAREFLAGRGVAEGARFAP